MRNLKIFTIGIMMQLFTLSCSATCSTSSKNYTFNSWTGSWEFSGFSIGPNSGEYYHLLSSSTDSQCAIIKESTSETLSWVKLYSAGKCSELTIDSGETYAYFANTEASEFAITQVNCSDGETNNHYTTSAFNVTGNIDSIDASGNSGYVMFGGNLLDTSGHYCSGYWDISGTSFQYECKQYNSFFGAFAIPDSYCTMDRNTASYEVAFTCYNISTSNRVWKSSYNISGGLSTQVPLKGKADIDSSNVYIAYDAESLEGVFITTINRANGSLVGDVRRRASSQNLTLGSIYATGSSIVYIGMYSSAAAYSELIKYNVSDFSYIIYLQTGLTFRYQFINTALSDCWYALVDTQYIHIAQLSAMSDITGLTIANETDTGLNNLTIFPGVSTTGTVTLTAGTFSTTTTNTASYFNMSTPYDTDNSTQTNTTTNSTTQTNTTTTQTNTTTTSNTTTTNTNAGNSSGDDSLSTVSIVFIVIGAAVAIVIGVGATVCVIRYHNKKRRNSRGDMTRIDTNPPNEPNQPTEPKEENKI